MRSTRIALAVAAILAISGCVAAPGPYYNSYPAYSAPYPAYSYGYGGPAYYGPAYVAGPTLAIGIGGGRGHWR
jgi:hypothetical protein